MSIFQYAGRHQTQTKQGCRLWLLVLWLSLLPGLAGSATTGSRPDQRLGDFSAYLALLRQVSPQRELLSQRVAALLRRDGDVPSSLSPSLLLVAFRDNDRDFQDVVVQIFRKLDEVDNPVLNPDGAVRARLGDDLYQSADHLMDLLYHHVEYLGAQRVVARQRRAFEAGLGGDLTFLRELTVEPLEVIAILPNAKPYLPRSLRNRVDSIVVDSKLSFGQWQTRIYFTSPDAETAAQVGFVVAAWRELAVHLADTFAADRTGHDLRQALHDATVKVVGNQVVSSGAIAAQTAVRVTNEFAGYGPPSRVTVCHKGHTLVISQSALPAHLDHGDTLGECPGQ